MVRVFAVAGNYSLAMRSSIVFLNMFWLMKVRSLSTLNKKRCQKLPQSFLFLEVGPPHIDCASFVSRFNNYVCVFVDFLVPTILSKKG